MSIFKDSITKNDVKGWSVHRRSLIWLGLAVACLVFNLLFPATFWDRYYYQGFFTGIRVVYDTLLGWIPIPMLYVLVVIILIRVVLWIRQRRKGIVWMLSKAIGGIAFLVFLFYVLWAFNYRQIPIPDRLGFQFDEVDSIAISAEFARASEALRNAALALPSQMTEDEFIQNSILPDKAVRKEVEKALAALQLPHKGNVRVRQVLPKGVLLRWSTAGIYIPQTFEGHIDAGLLSVQKPFTMAHEMAHGYGVADEGACNFIAWLACDQSDNPWIKFGGALTYWRYAAVEMPRDSIDNRINSFPPVIKRAIELVRENDKKYPDLLPKYRDAIYNNYLKRHGVKKGLQSYNEVVMMVQQYLKRTQDK